MEMRHSSARFSIYGMGDVPAFIIKVEGSISTYTLTHMQFANGRTITFNAENMTITCSCRKYESIGMYIFFSS
jgi:hypothetical protein